MDKKFQTLIIETDANRRSQLKQATLAVTLFGKFNSAESISSARDLLARESTGEIDIVFISHLIPENEVAPFIKNAKENPLAQDAAFVLIAPTTDDMQTVIAQYILHGIDGFLAEPYSVDALVEITRLANEIKKKRSATREINAIQLIMTEIAEQVNKIAMQEKLDVPTGRDKKKLKQMCAVIEELDDEARGRYMDIAVDIFETAALPKELTSSMYKGASKRTQQRLEAKLKAKLEAEQRELEAKEA